MTGLLYLGVPEGLQILQHHSHHQQHHPQKQLLNPIPDKKIFLQLQSILQLLICYHPVNDLKISPINLLVLRSIAFAFGLSMIISKILPIVFVLIGPSSRLRCETLFFSYEPQELLCIEIKASAAYAFLGVIMSGVDFDFFKIFVIFFNKR